MATLDNAHATAKPLELDVLVVGGGIAGMAAAAALSRAGHRVTLFEKSTFKREAGFMITLGCNAMRVLSTFGFDYVKARATDCDQMTVYDSNTLELVHAMDTTRYAESPETRTRTFYRPDLHSELKRLAISPPHGHRVVTLLLGAEVVEVDIEAGTVRLANGKTYNGDVIIGADGERSTVKAAFKEADYLRQAPFKVYRCLIPTEKVLEDESSKKLLNMVANQFAMFSDGGIRVISWFAARDGTLQDLEVACPIFRPEDKAIDTDPAKAKAKMLKLYGDYNPEIVKVLQKVDKVTDWGVYNSLPLPHLFKGKALLIGDAAHSMLPTTGQGGCQSIEDIGALSVLLSSIQHRSQIPTRFQLIDSLRKERIHTVQTLSGLVFGQEETLVRDFPRHRIHRTHIRSGKEHMDFLMGYDIIAESKKALEKAETPRALL